MILGVLQFDVHVHDAGSLKDKRRVVSSLKDRLHREHQAAVAEVAFQDALNVARLGLAVVGSDGRHVGQMLDRITAKIRAILGPEAELGECSRQVLSPQPGAEETDADSSGDADDAALAREMLLRAREAAEDAAGESAAGALEGGRGNA